MSVPARHFLLYAEAAQAADAIDSNVSRWRFVLRSRGGETSLEAADEEPEAGPERLELLAGVPRLGAPEAPSPGKPPARRPDHFPRPHLRPSPRRAKRTAEGRPSRAGP